VNYPYRSDAQEAILTHMPDSPYSGDSKPYLSTERYSVIGYEESDVRDKRLLDESGLADGWFWYNRTRHDNLAVNFGQR
jgi:hypothetical protein